MRQPATRELFAYWDRLRKGRAAPERAEIDPAAIRNVLADTFLLEIDSACLFPIRLSGTRLNALWLAEQKGRSFLDLWAEDERRDAIALILTVLDGTHPVIAGVSAAPPGRPAMDMEMLLLPLRHNGKTHARVLGCITPGAREPWFGLVAAEKLVLQSMRVIGIGDLDDPEPPRWTNSVQTPVARRGHLTVYAGGV
ncbi:MAG: PAS domain-containing protein [Methylobacteriaceae bacterium]|nr:PAS domain-containing protein [Methylobacteriaceae bacterium]